MKVLLHLSTPFSLMHGGQQVQVEQTKAALEAAGVEVEYLRWWDDTQTCDIIHSFERFGCGYIRLAQKKGIKVVIAPLLTGLGSRSPRALLGQRLIIFSARRALPEMLKAPFGWDCFAIADASVALTPWEAHLMRYVFGAPPQRVRVVPNGVEDVFFEPTPATRGKWLVCTATITERKRVLELAQAAVQAQTPLWVMGKPYSDTDEYARRFAALAKASTGIIRYEGPIRDRAKIAHAYREARGFVLLSTMESLSLSALEAAACGCPLLLSDLPWARATFGENASYCPVASTARTAEVLKKFHAAAPGLKPPPKPLTWLEVARQLKSLYEQLLAAK